MAPLTRAQFDQLLQVTQPRCISIYLPTERTAAQAQQNPIRLKNLIRQAAHQLADSGRKSTEIRRDLQPLRALLHDNEYWQHQDQGLALFLCDHHLTQLPSTTPFAPFVTVARRFHLKPLFPLLNTTTPFFILCLSGNRVTLLQASRHHIQPVPLEGAPTNFAHAMRFDDPEKQLQSHTGNFGGGQAGPHVSVFHGHGSDDATEKKRLLEYCRMIDAPLTKFLLTQNAPLLLAATEPLLSIFRETTTYRRLLPHSLTGNPDQLEPHDLHRQALPLVEPLFHQTQQRDADRYHDLRDTPQATSDLQSILIAAHRDQIESLFVALDEYRWGRFDPAAGTILTHPTPQLGDQDLLDLAAVRSYQSASRVHALPRAQLPGNALAAAVLRFVVQP
jgi:hypothetical protein